MKTVVLIEEILNSVHRLVQNIRKLFTAIKSHLKKPKKM